MVPLAALTVRSFGLLEAATTTARYVGAAQIVTDRGALQALIARKAEHREIRCTLGSEPTRRGVTEFSSDDGAVERRQLIEADDGWDLKTGAWLRPRARCPDHCAKPR